MIDEGMVWIDKQAGGEPEYWFPSLFEGQDKSQASPS